MAKLQLVVSPTFKATVAIAVAGGDSVDVEFEFKHRTKDALEAFVKAGEGRSDINTLKEMAIGWDVEGAELGKVAKFDDANIELFFQNYFGAPIAIYEAYLSELVRAKAKN